MEISFDSFFSILGLFIGGSGGAFFMWKWQRRKAKAEAESAEVDTVKNMQEAYEKMFQQVNNYLDDATGKIEGLRQERDHYKQERDELRERMDQLSRSVMEWKRTAEDDRADMKRTISRLGRKVDAMTPFMCGRPNCPERLHVTVSDEGDVKTKRTRPKADASAVANGDTSAKDIEPLDMKDL